MKADEIGAGKRYLQRLRIEGCRQDAQDGHHPDQKQGGRHSARLEEKRK